MTTNASPSCPQCGAPIPEGSADGLCPRCVFAKAMAPTADGGSVPHLPPSLESVRAAFPHLEVTGLIGSGGMGAVFKARQPQLDRFVALKILPTELAGQPGFSERFQREAQALARLSHPHIVTIHDFGQAGGFYFLLMEFIDGVNLRQLLKTKRLTPKEALSIVPPICEALQCAHDHGIVHRDIKPENPLIDKAGSVKIADFGIAKIIAASSAETAGDTTGASSSAATLALGTPDYAAPEQRDASATTDHRADIYSLGVVLYEMLNGERPTDKLEAPSKRVQMDVRINEIVLRALETKPELRFQTVAEMRTQVEAITHGAPKAEAQAGASDPPTGPASVQRSSEAPASLRPTVILHTVLFTLVCFALLVGIPQYMQVLMEMRRSGVHVGLPALTRIVVEVGCTWGLLVFPLLLGMDVAMCFLVRALGGQRGLRWWSGAVIVGLVFMVAVSGAALWLPMRKVEIGPIAPSTYVFGPVTERVLPFDRSCIDFQTGSVMRPDFDKFSVQARTGSPGLSRRALMRWPRRLLVRRACQ